MKRFAVALLVVLLACSLCACGIYSQDEVDRIIEREYQRGYDAGQTAGYNSGYSSGYDDGSSVCSNSIDADTYADLKEQSDSLFSAISLFEDYIDAASASAPYETKTPGKMTTSEALKIMAQEKDAVPLKVTVDGESVALSSVWTDIYLAAKDYTSAVELLKVRAK